MSPDDVLHEGNAVLRAVLAPAGFSDLPIAVGDGSGGRFAWTLWVDQWIELHVRASLGMVTYGWGGELFPHVVVAEALSVRATYPGFSHDPLDVFRHLAADLHGPLADVISARHAHVLSAVRSWVPGSRRLPP